MTPLRYVILHHRDPAGEHWDLLIEQEELLAAWRLETDPVSPEVLPVRGHRIQNHRKVYLDYQGPVSGDRGYVTRVDEGQCAVAESGTAQWRFEVTGRRLVGRFRLRCLTGSDWVLESE